MNELLDIDLGQDADLFDDIESFGSDDGIDGELDDIEAEVDAYGAGGGRGSFRPASRYGSARSARSVRYGAEGVNLVPATVNLPAAKNRFIWPELLRDMAEWAPNFQVPFLDYEVNPVTPITYPIYWAEDGALDLAQALQSRVEAPPVGGGVGFPEAGQGTAQVDAIRALVQDALVAGPEGSGFYRAMEAAWNRSAGKELDERVKEAAAGSVDALEALLSQDIPAIIDIANPALSGGNQPINTYGIFLCLADLAGLDPFGRITSDLISSGALTVSQRPSDEQAARAAARRAAQAGASSAPPASYAEEAVPASKPGFFGQIDQPQMVGLGYAGGIAWATFLKGPVTRLLGLK